MAACRTSTSTTTTSTVPSTTTTSAVPSTTSTTSAPATTTTVTLPPGGTTSTVPGGTTSTSLPPTTTSSVPPTTTTTTTSSTTTTTFPATPCGERKIAEPKELPDQAVCDAAGAGKAECNGWTPVGRLYTGDDDLASTSDGTAQLYVWKSAAAKTTCFYLYRVQALDPPATRPKTLNGVHCYNTDSCEVCAWDLQVRKPAPGTVVGPAPKFAQLKFASSNAIEDCSECHSSGPVTPMKRFYDDVKGETSTLNRACAKAGGPKWVKAPASWQQQDATRKVASQPGCDSCHDNFVKTKQRLADPSKPAGPANPLINPFCQTILIPAFRAPAAAIPPALATKGGAMKGSGKNFDYQEDCEEFARHMQCTAADTTVLCAGLPKRPPPPAKP